MTNDTGWLISVFSLAIALASLWIVKRARDSWQREIEILRGGMTHSGSELRDEVGRLRETLNAIGTGMVSSRESLREGRLNLSMRSHALQMLRSGSAPETVASSLGIASSEARLLARVSQLLAAGPESALRS